MKKALSILCIVLGILAIPACGMALFMMMGFGGMRLGSREGMGVMALGLMGPLALLPAGLLGRTRPRLAGLWLLAGGIGSTLFYYGPVEGDGLTVLLYFRLQDWAPLLFGWIPQMLLGTGLLVPGPRTAEPPPKRVYWPLVFIVPTVLLCAASLTDLQNLFRDHHWTLTIEPAGGAPVSFRLDDRDDPMLQLRKAHDPLAEFFRAPTRPSDRRELGRCRLVGPREGAGRAGGFDDALELRREGESLVLYRNGEKARIGNDDGLTFSGVYDLMMDISRLLEEKRIRNFNR